MRNLAYVILLLAIVGCYRPQHKPKVYVYTKKQLVGKNVELADGRTRYVLGFHDGFTYYTTFGNYSCLNVGDSVEFERESDWPFWHISQVNY